MLFVRRCLTQSLLTATLVSVSFLTARVEGQFEESSSSKTVTRPVDRLETMIQVNAGELPLRIAVEQLAQSIGLVVNWDLDALDRAGYDIEQVVTCRVNQKTLKEAVGQLLQRAAVHSATDTIEIQLCRNGLMVTTREAARARISKLLPDQLRQAYFDELIDVGTDEQDAVVSISIKKKLPFPLLPHIGTLVHLRELEVCSNPADAPTDATELRKLDRLELLFLSFQSERNDGFADAILEAVSRSTSIKTLILVEAGVTDVGLRYLEHASQLAALDIRREGRLTGKSIESIARLTSLERLELIGDHETKLGWMQFSSEAEEALANCAHLKIIHRLQSSVVASEWPSQPTMIQKKGRVFDRELATRLAASKDLESLTLDFETITDDALEPLSGHPALFSLTIESRNFSDEGLSHLKRCPRLEEVRLHTHGLTDRSLANLAQIDSLRSVTINWRTNSITTAGLKRLARLPQLRMLSVNVLNPSRLVPVQIERDDLVLERLDILKAFDGWSPKNFDARSLLVDVPHREIRFGLDMLDKSELRNK